MRVACRTLLILLGLVYLLALGVMIIGTYGYFGYQPDPLSGVYLLPLGLPWNMAIDIFPEPLWPWLGAGAPAINLLILWSVCRARSINRN